MFLYEFMISPILDKLCSDFEWLRKRLCNKDATRRYNFQCHNISRKLVSQPASFLPTRHFPYFPIANVILPQLAINVKIQKHPITIKMNAFFQYFMQSQGQCDIFGKWIIRNCNLAIYCIRQKLCVFLAPLIFFKYENGFAYKSLEQLVSRK